MTEEEKSEINSEPCACGHRRDSHEFYKGDQHECGKFLCKCKHFQPAPICKGCGEIFLVRQCANYCCAFCEAEMFGKAS